MITVVHPTGNANVRAVLDGLLEAEILNNYHTTIATYPKNTFGFLSKLGPFSEFGRRSFSPGIQPFTHTYPWLELGRLFSKKAGWNSLVRQEEGVFCIDSVYRGLDSRVANGLKKDDGRAIYAYEDGALNLFETAPKVGAIKLYDLPIGYWRTSRRLLGEVAKKRPEWASTIKGMRDSDEKLARKDRELALADHIFVASSFTASTLKDYPGKLCPVHVIPYGFPSPATNREYAPAKNRTLNLLFVGGLSQRKGIAEIFEAVERFGDRVKLTIVGGKPIDSCKVLEDNLNKHHYIPSLPHAEILKLMRTQDVFLFPSLFEGFGLVITEAMSQGTLVIATNRTAGPDLITHGKDGFLIEAGSTDALANQIGALLEEPEQIERVGRAALARAAQRPWSVYGHELATKIKSIIA